MHGLYAEYVVDFLNEKDHKEVKVRQEKAPQKSIYLASSLKDLIKKLAKPNQ